MPFSEKVITFYTDWKVFKEINMTIRIIRLAKDAIPAKINDFILLNPLPTHHLLMVRKKIKGEQEFEIAINFLIDTIQLYHVTIIRVLISKYDETYEN